MTNRFGTMPHEYLSGEESARYGRFPGDGDFGFTGDVFEGGDLSDAHFTGGTVPSPEGGFACGVVAFRG